MASLSVAKVAILQLFYVCMHVYACVCVNAHECASTCVHAHRDQRTASAFTLQPHAPASLRQGVSLVLGLTM